MALYHKHHALGVPRTSYISNWRKAVFLGALILALYTISQVPRLSPDSRPRAVEFISEETYHFWERYWTHILAAPPPCPPPNRPDGRPARNRWNERLKKGLESSSLIGMSYVVGACIPNARSSFAICAAHLFSPSSDSSLHPGNPWNRDHGRGHIYAPANSVHENALRNWLVASC
ncbi:hypothetical protein MMC12_002695 [Toensbergia leucococca]|nr:hypothetical protein [Toensbergia leucococca]